MGKVLVIKGADFSTVAINDLLPSIKISIFGVVEITCDIVADIYYTTNGSTPSAQSTPYESSFSVEDGTTVKAIAIVGQVVSEIVSQTYEGLVGIYKENYTLGYSTQQSTTLEEIAANGFGISDFIPIEPNNRYKYDFGILIKGTDMYDNYWKYKIVEYDANKNVVVNSVAHPGSEYNVSVGTNAVWSLRTGTNDWTYKRIITQPNTRYLKVVALLNKTAAIRDEDNNNELVWIHEP